MDIVVDAIPAPQVGIVSSTISTTLDHTLRHCMWLVIGSNGVDVAMVNIVKRNMSQWSLGVAIGRSNHKRKTGADMVSTRFHAL